MPAAHEVLYWETRDYRTQEVARYLADGLAQGKGIVAFTDAQQLAALQERMGPALARARDDGRAVLIDVAASGVLVDGQPDRDMFMATIQGAAGRVLGRYPGVRFYGDLVDRMCQEGDLAAALRLECWCNEILAGAGGAAEILCGYRAETIPRPAAVSAARICAQHTGTRMEGAHSPATLDPPTWPHRVRFFDDDASLTACVGGFLSEGARQGEAVVAIATAKHLRGISAYETPGRPWILLDAEDILGDILVAGRPSAGRFARIAAELEAMAGGRRMRAYGEMVEVLASRGDWVAAIELEAIWNAYGAKRPLTLLCGYSAHHLARAPAASVRHACIEHLLVETARAHRKGVVDLLGPAADRVVAA